MRGLMKKYVIGLCRRIVSKQVLKGLFVFIAVPASLTCTLDATPLGWTGAAGDNSWHTAANWSGMPGLTLKVIRLVGLAPADVLTPSSAAPFLSGSSARQGVAPAATFGCGTRRSAADQGRRQTGQ